MKKPPEAGRKGVYASARMGEPNKPESHYGYLHRARMLELNLIDGCMPPKDSIDAAISFLHAVVPTCEETATLHSEHLMVIGTAIGALQTRGRQIGSETTDLIVKVAEEYQNPEVRENFYRHMKELFDF